MTFNTTNETLNHVEDYEGKEFIGTVINNVDPLGLGRIQVSVPDLYDPNAGEVPWVGRNHESPYGFGTSSTGQFGVYGSPQLNTKVRITLQHGDVHYPMYEPIQTQPDSNPSFTNPLVWGFKDPSGSSLLVDMRTNTWTFTHASGDIVQYLGNGDRLELIKGNDSLTVNKALTIVVKGNCIVQSDTRIDVQAPLTTLNSITPLPN